MEWFLTDSEQETGAGQTIRSVTVASNPHVATSGEVRGLYTSGILGA